MAISDGGKGSDRRPGKGYGAGWERIFGKGADAAAKGADEGVCIECIDSASTSESAPGAVDAKCVEPPLRGFTLCNCIKPKSIQK